MKAFFNTVKSFLSLGTGKSEEAIAEALTAPSVAHASAVFADALTTEPRKVLAAVCGVDEVVDWATWHGDDQATKLIAAGGRFDGDEPIVMVKLWAAPDAGFKKGCPVYASVEENKMFSWVVAQPTLEKDGKPGNDPGSFFTELDADTGEMKSDVLFAGVRTKFKLAGNMRDASTVEAIGNIEGWMLAGDGTRRDLLVIAQLRGEAKEETDNKTKATTGSMLQMVSGLVVIELPRLRAKGKLAGLKGSATPVTVRKGGKPAPKPTPASSVPATMAEALDQANAEAKAGGAELGEFAKRMLADGNDL